MEMTCQEEVCNLNEVPSEVNFSPEMFRDQKNISKPMEVDDVEKIFVIRRRHRTISIDDSELSECMKFVANGKKVLRSEAKTYSSPPKNTLPKSHLHHGKRHSSREESCQLEVGYQP